VTAPAWRQLESILLERITSGQYAPGVLIPSDNAMVAEFSVSRNTVRRAVAALRYDGWVVPSAAAVGMSLIRSRGRRLDR
jgi:GntR family transcriptional regulator